MSKKRKAPRQAVHVDKATDSKLRVKTFEDVADSEDEFHINQDKILLEEGPVQKKRRKAREEDEYLDFSDEEVLSASPSLNEYGSVDRDSSEESDSRRNVTIPPKKAVKGPPSSGSESARAISDDDDVGGWGTSKNDYYNADVIETEADAVEEEAETKRLQQKYLQGMIEADFGFNEADWLGDDDDSDIEGQERDGNVTEALPQQEITESMGPDERMKILRTRYPEFEPLAKEFLELEALHEDLAPAAAVAYKDQHEDKLSVAAIKHSALSAYLGVLCMYFSLLTSGRTGPDSEVVAMPPNELRDHPIMDTLVRTRELWGRVKNMIVSESLPVNNTTLNGVGDTDKDHEVHVAVDKVATSDKPKSRKRKSRAERAAMAAQAKADARRLERLQKTEVSLASLSELTTLPSKPKKAAREASENEEESDFGDPTHLEAHEAAQKAARKKSLKFYTSQIASKQEKRGAAGRDAGGDVDLPYKERLRDRQERLNAQAEKKGKKGPPTEEEALGGESDEEDVKAARELRENGEDEYYELVASKASAKKAAKAKQAAEQAAAANGMGHNFDNEMEGADGKRAISYAIKKNKGLHAKRKKEVRNPRVKKRKKFEEKKKRLGSVRHVYKGGEGKGYQGELTGIKRNLVRSVKL